MKPNHSLIATNTDKSLTYVLLLSNDKAIINSIKQHYGKHRYHFVQCTDANSLDDSLREINFQLAIIDTDNNDLTIQDADRIISTLNLLVIYLISSTQNKLLENISKKNGNQYYSIKKDNRLIHELPRFISNIIENKSSLSANQQKQQFVEEQLRAIKKDFFHVFEYANIGIALVSPNGYYLKINEEFCSILGYSSEEIKDIHYNFFTHPDDLELTQNVYSRFISGQLKKHTYEKRYIGKKGNIIWVSLSVTLLHDSSNNPKHFIIHIQDITAKKQDEIKLTQFYKSVEQSPAIVIITDERGLITYTNPKFEEITGYSAEEVAGKNPNILKSNHHDDSFYKHLWATLKAGNTWKGELINKKKNGKLYWESASIAPIKIDTNHSTHYIAIKEDISEKKKLERELISAKDAAEKSANVKASFLKIMSHELRTPLNAILGFSEIIMSEKSETNITEFMPIIHENGELLLNQVNDILSYLEIDSGEIKLKMEPVDINKLLMEVQSEFIEANKSYARGIELILDNNTHFEQVIISDKAHLKKIITCLIDNAIKFTKKGKVNFGYRFIRKRNSLQMYVKDTGIGIPEDKRAIIFDIFRQADESYTRPNGGIGLGLSIAQKLCKQLGSEIKVEPNTNEGVEFNFNLKWLTRFPL